MRRGGSHLPVPTHPFPLSARVRGAGACSGCRRGRGHGRERQHGRGRGPALCSRDRCTAWQRAMLSIRHRPQQLYSHKVLQRAAPAVPAMIYTSRNLQRKHEPYGATPLPLTPPHMPLEQRPLHCMPLFYTGFIGRRCVGCLAGWCRVGRSGARVGCTPALHGGSAVPCGRCGLPLLL